MSLLLLLLLLHLPLSLLTQRSLLKLLISITLLLLLVCKHHVAVVATSIPNETHAADSSTSSNTAAHAADNILITKNNMKMENFFNKNHNDINDDSVENIATTTAAATPLRATAINTSLSQQVSLVQQQPPQNTTKILKRGKRYLDFLNGSRMSWRTSAKNNILEENTLWGYGYGFRVNFPFIDRELRQHPFSKRDIFQSFEDILNGHGLDGRACILKSFCSAFLDVDSNIGAGMLYKLLKLIFDIAITETEIELKSNNNSETAHNVTSTRHLSRGKRYLDFLDTTRMFYRVNSKNNIIPKPIIWAHAYGYRANLPMLNDRKVRPFRRDTYELLGELMDKNGYDGQACILKAFCTAHMPLEKKKLSAQGVLFKLLKYIFTLNAEDKRHLPYLRMENCDQILHSHCPLSFNSISPYTDDV